MPEPRMSDDEFRQLVQRTLGAHETRMGHLEDLLERQQTLQASLLQLLGTIEARMTQNETRIAQNEEMLRQLIDIQRRRNGHS